MTPPASKSIWRRLFNPEPIVVKEADPFDMMVGEPVISFLQALKREPKRFRVKELSYGTFPVPGFERYRWMEGTDTRYWKLIDKKTGREYPAITHDRKLYEVYTLPFSLNYWEKKATEEALKAHRMPAIQRAEEISSRAWIKARQAQRSAEELARETFAQQFREGGR